jgi:hypothetical protein
VVPPTAFERQRQRAEFQLARLVDVGIAEEEVGPDTLGVRNVGGGKGALEHPEI